MKKMRKIFAVLLTLAMVLGMSMTTFAAGSSATITLNNLDDAESLKMIQIIKPNPSTSSGWEFINGAEAAFITAIPGKNAQSILWGLVKYQITQNGGTFEAPAGVTDIATITSSDIDKALENIEFANARDLTGETSVTVSTAGVYAFSAAKTGYVYRVMSAYVGFGVAQDGTYPSLEDTSVSAKRSSNTVTKTTTDENHVVAIGDTVEYSIETEVPFIPANHPDNRTFKITDKISGADYITDSSSYTIKMGTTKATATPVADASIAFNGDKFEIDLSSLVSDISNPNYGKKIFVTYKAKITAVHTNNTAKGHFPGSETDSDPVNLYTGQITLFKHDSTNTTKGLANAEFTVSKDGHDLKFVYNSETGKYTYAPNDASASTTIKTGTDGNVIIEGLDVGDYVFTETKAPTGYSKANVTKTITISQTGVASKIIEVGDDLANTKLSALPSTGGIGTTIFTIAGCVIMIAAAGLFFASRKKSDNK